ncbi:MAG TPA: DNA-binding protein [Thermoplasmatales archaeon]|nr:DNA-binding protein [Thermoplasmatales archaeon]
MADDISSYIDDIVAIIGEDTEVEREDLEKEFRRFLEYGVPPDQAKKTLVKKFTNGRKVAERKRLDEIKPNESSVNLLCRIVTINPKEVNVRGESKKIFYGLLGDESGIAPFTSWTSSLPVEKGDVVEINNAYTREWQGVVQVNFGERTVVKKVEDSRLPEISYEPKPYKIADLHTAFGEVEVTAKILDVSEKDVEVNGEKKRVYVGMLGDETGKAQYTAWHDFKLKKGDVVRIVGGYTRFWKGIPQLTFDERAKVEKVAKEIEVSSQKIPLHKLVERRGGLDVSVEGTVIEIRDGSGFIERCPECNRLIQNGECRIHGKVKGVSDLRAKIVVDDGTAGIGAVIGRDLTERLIGKSLEECKDIVSKKGVDAVMELLEKSLAAKRVSLRGNALGDEYGTTLIAREAEVVNQDIRKEATVLLQEMEGET